MSQRKFSIGIVGCGVVGSAIARSYLEYARVKMYDLVKERRTCYNPQEVMDCEIVFICLPEDQIPIFLPSIVLPKHGCFVIKSTVSIGTTLAFRDHYDLPNLIHSPEFLTERCAFEDASNPTRNIIGIPNGEDCFGRHELEALYRQRWPHVPVHIMTSDESEAVKLMQNAFFATKIAFWNEMYSLAEKLGLRWEMVLNAILADGRINPSHTKVPGPDGKRGYGGKCLPKDLEQLIEIFINNEIPPYILANTALYAQDIRKDM